VPLLPSAHAAFLLRPDAGGRTLFLPDGDESESYVVPDAETEQRIFDRLKRIRSAELAGWVLLAIAFMAVLVATDGALPEWLFLVALVGAVMVITFAPDYARQRLTRGLDRAPAQTPQPSLLEMLPLWVIILVVGVAIGVAVYLGRTWPIEVLAWLGQNGPEHIGSKGLAKLAVLIAGAVAILWGGVVAIRKRL
jgi:Na+/H+ antiporter NhaD/arsenite permease-like protein